jgi:hypothetical protein
VAKFSDLNRLVSLHFSMSFWLPSRVAEEQRDQDLAGKLGGAEPSSLGMGFWKRKERGGQQEKELGSKMRRCTLFAHQQKRDYGLSTVIPFAVWSWRWDLNPQPADYKSAALPLSYASSFRIAANYKRHGKRCKLKLDRVR